MIKRRNRRGSFRLALHARAPVVATAVLRNSWLHSQECLRIVNVRSHADTSGLFKRYVADHLWQLTICQRFYNFFLSTENSFAKTKKIFLGAQHIFLNKFKAVLIKLLFYHLLISQTQFFLFYLYIILLYFPFIILYTSPLINVLIIF